MAFRDLIQRKKSRRNEAPALEIVNPAMMPGQVQQFREVPGRGAGDDRGQEAAGGSAEGATQPKKRGRGRPRSAVNNNAHLHIKCPDKLMYDFKLLSVQERMSYPELLQKIMHVYEAYGDVDDDR